MPLFMCPNCQTEMKEINRQGVKIDMCGQCHGVWLDRGELQKLLQINQQELNESYIPQSAQQHSQPAYNDPHRQPSGNRDYDDRFRQYGKHHKHHKKSKFESIFDVFDL